MARRRGGDRPSRPHFRGRGPPAHGSLPSLARLRPRHGRASPSAGPVGAGAPAHRHEAGRRGARHGALRQGGTRFPLLRPSHPASPGWVSGGPRARDRPAFLRMHGQPPARRATRSRRRWRNGGPVPACQRRAPMRRQLIVLALAWLLAPSILPAASRTLRAGWSFPVQAGKRIVVDTSDMDIHLRVGDVNEIRVSVDARISNVTEHQAESWIAGHTPKIEDTGNALRIETSKGPRGILGHLTAKAKLSIVAPISTVPDLATLSGDISVRGDFPSAAPLRLATMTGNVHFVGAARSLTAIATSGKIDLVVVRPLEELVVRTTSGRVTLAGGTRTASVDTASGDIDLQDLSGGAQVSTASGSIQMRWDRLDTGQRVSIRSIRGPVRLALPPGVQPSGTLRTTKGTIESRLSGSLSPDGTVLELKGNGPVLDVETTKARILVEA
ncbi:MAG TPA: hypothetical protein ENK19_08845, partial [Acidobacteria bacterium]|nr:hypothetical protein [Acidobacteriota bacterium]